MKEKQLYDEIKILLCFIEGMMENNKDVEPVYKRLSDIVIKYESGN